MDIMDIKKYAISVVLILIIVAITIILLLSANQPQSEIDAGQSGITPDECTSKGGEIVNTLDGASCKSQNDFFGNVVGLKCPCICCRK